MPRYFKLVALNAGKEAWMKEEFDRGRVRFGWSGPGSDLRVIGAKPPRERTPSERTTWRYTQFLTERVRPGDRVVVQLEQPLRRFLIAEVTEEAYGSSDPELPDFNHVLHCRPLTDDFVPVNAAYVPASLKHDLTKRGQYYEVYPERSLRALDELVATRPCQREGPGEERTERDELDETWEAVKDHVVDTIRRRWPAKEFERFCADLCERIDHVEVKERKDRGQGWDMLLRIVDPVSGGVLPGYESVPVQCKNFSGAVTTSRPIEDLVRCVEANGECSVAYLFILGDLTDGFLEALEAARNEVLDERGRDVAFHVIDQDRIAELYLRYAGREGAADAA